MRYITRTQLNEYANEIVDEETGMTYLDYLEWLNPYEEWVIIEDKNTIWGDDDPNKCDEVYCEIIDQEIENELDNLDIDDIVETYLKSELAGKFFLEECIITRLV